MKILALSNLYPPDVLGGYEIACAQAVDALRARGHDVLVLTTTPRKPVPHDPTIRRSLKLADVYDSYVMTQSAPTMQRLLDFESRWVISHNVHVLSGILEEFRPDVAYVNNVMGLGGLGMIGCLEHLKVPWAWQLGDCVPLILCCAPIVVQPALAEAFTRQVRGRYISVSRRLVDEIEDNGPKLRGGVDFLPYWIHGPRPAPRTRAFDGTTLRVVSAGRVDSTKGIDILIEAAGLLKASGFTNFVVDVYGHLAEAGIPTLINKFEVRDHVFLKGSLPQDRLLERYNDYDVFAFPTWAREPFGMAPLEAAARGCVPLISQDCGIAEWLVHGVDCLKADRTAVAFAGALRGILEGSTPLGPIARRATAVAWRDFHLDGLVGKIEAILESASRQSRAGAGTAAEAYRLALLAEKLTHVLLHEGMVA